MTGADQFIQQIAEAVVAKLRASGIIHENGTSSQPARLMTITQAAVYTGRTKKAMEHLVANKIIPVVRSDRKIFLDRTDLDEWIQANKEPA